MIPRTPNYALLYDYEFRVGKQESRTLPAGSWVRPINRRWVPTHVLEDPYWKSFHESAHVFCYTRYGIIAVPKNYVAEK